MPLAGFELSKTYRVRTTSGLHDVSGRALSDARVLTFTLPDPIPVGQIGTLSFTYERIFPINYDTYFASGTDAGLFPGGQPMLFQGAWTDPVTGLQYKRERFYDPRNASWLSPDPMEDRDSPNLYGFVGARPHEKTDPLGLQSADGLTPGEDAHFAVETWLDSRSREERSGRTVGRIAGGFAAGLDIATDLGPGIGWVKFGAHLFEAFLSGDRTTVMVAVGTVAGGAAVAILARRYLRLRQLGAKAVNEVDEATLAAERRAAAELNAEAERASRSTLNKLFRETEGGSPLVSPAVPRRTTSQNSSDLSRNLSRERRDVSEGEAAGHIVASTGTRGHWAPSARSREILERYGIGINDAANGLPIGHPRPHSIMHTRAFQLNVEARLRAIVDRMQAAGYGWNAIRGSLRRELREIGNEVRASVQ